MLNNIHIILVSPSHPGNIGAAARAMKTMGLSNLRLVNPTEKYPCGEATALAAGADDVLQNAQTFSSLDDALADCGLIIGTSARLRQLPVSMLEPRQCGTMAVQRSSDAKVAILFGREHAGLTNEELNHCHYHVHIPTVAAFSSLNLAAAVQILCYELRMASLDNEAPQLESRTEEPACHKEVEMFYQRLEQLLKDISFVKQSNVHKIMARLRRLFNRAYIEKAEYDLLMGVLTAIEKNK